MNTKRQYSLRDKACLSMDALVRALFDNPTTTGRAYPAEKEKETPLSPEENRHSAALMRINHAGEICAQALYHGQSVVSRSNMTRDKLRQAAVEEGDHLTWCSQRLNELGSHTSYLNPLWYMGSFCIGVAAGMTGDQWSLGFVAETEKQVVKHLEKHLQLLPEKDHKSHKILQQMQLDEEKHQQDAMHLGASLLPRFIQKIMRCASRVMVKAAYRV